VIAGGSPEAGAAQGRTQLPLVGVAVVAAAASIFFGIVPSPLLQLASDAASALGVS
jgi:hypothetical protein